MQTCILDAHIQTLSAERSQFSTCFTCLLLIFSLFPFDFLFLFYLFFFFVVNFWFHFFLWNAHGNGIKTFTCTHILTEVNPNIFICFSHRFSTHLVMSFTQSAVSLIASYFVCCMYVCMYVSMYPYVNEGVAIWQYQFPHE